MSTHTHTQGKGFDTLKYIWHNTLVEYEHTLDRVVVNHEDMEFIHSQVHGDLIIDHSEEDDPQAYRVNLDRLFKQRNGYRYFLDSDDQVDMPNHSHREIDQHAIDCDHKLFND